MPSTPRQLSHNLPAALCAAVFLVLPAAPAGAQLAANRAAIPNRPAGIAAVITTDCAGGVVVDDGSFEIGVRFTDESTGPGLRDAVMRFELAASVEQIEQICLCWLRGTNAPADLAHDLLVFAADGPGGAPGTQIAVVPADAEGIGTGPTIFGYDVSALDIQSTGGQVYVGARWNGRGGATGQGIFLCTDEDGPGGQPMYAKVSDQTTWESFDEVFAPPDFPPKALGVRIDTEPLILPCPTAPCVDDELTLCLNGDRFAVQASFDPPNDDDDVFEPAHRQELTTDTGYFWFFRDTNVEMVLKVLDGCGVNDRFWVFAGGLTNVAVEIEVCDTLAGLKRLYSNPQETPFQPIQDTGAFATCP